MDLARVTLVSCLLIGSCLGQNWQEYNGYWYSVSSGNPGNWHDARSFCQRYGGDLASILDPNERDYVLKTVETSGYTGPFWVGLNNLDRTSWKWSDGTSTVPNYWAEDYPTADDVFGEYHLCATQEGITWKNQHCDTKYGFVCKAEIGATGPITAAPTDAVGGYCPSGYFGIGNKCFKMMFLDPSEGVTWKEAVTRCRSGPGLRPDIASIGSDFENALLTTQLQNQTYGLWIGLSRNDYYSDWKWMDNSATSFLNWGPNEPSFSYTDNCAEVWFNPGPPGTWNNIQCDSKRGFICQTYKDDGNIVPTPNPTTPNTCDPGYTPYWYGCYKFIPANNTWANQEATCQLEGGHLASIHYEAENSALMVKAIQHGERVWIGFRDFKGQGLFEWSDAWQAFYTNWGNGEPSRVEDGLGGCVSMDPDGRWYDTECDASLAAICKKTSASPITTPTPLEGACPGEQFGETSWVKFGSYCYYREDVGKTWQLAKEDCIKKDPSASLVSIHSYPENEFVFDLMSKDSYYNAYWTGLYRKTQSGNYAWVDNSVLIYENWAPGEPNGAGTEDCVEMYTGSIYPKQWNDQFCSYARPYLCKAPQSNQLTPPPDVDGTCPDGDWVPYGGNCYLFLADVLGIWATAVSTCQSRGGLEARLPIITNQFLNMFIRDEMVARNEFPSGVGWDYWIGLIKDGAGGEEAFYWMTGDAFEPKVFSQWADGEPNDHQGKENCVEAYRNDAKWNDISCSVTRAFVCEVPKTPLNKGLSAGGIAGVVLGVLAFVILLIAVLVFVLEKKGVVSISGNAKGLMGFANDNYKDMKEETDSTA